MRVLAVNAGSSSLKLTLFGEEQQTIARCELDAPAGEVDEAELRGALDSPLGEAEAVGHRIVHGGERFSGPVLLDENVEQALRELTDLAPLHQPKSLAALDAVSRALGHLPAVACFDTAFHQTIGPAASTYALPSGWNKRWGLRRYGFHGLSHGWIAERVPQLLERPGEGLRIVSCHLGAGASLCAIADGRSVDTTMGFTPLEGLVMATRSGSVDPGLLLWLLEHRQMPISELADALEHRSGMLGLSGSADMHEILDRAAAGEETARAAIEVYGHRLRAGIAAMAAALGGIDALVFTGGVGEHAPEVRSLAARKLRFLGVSIDESRNRSAAGDCEIGAEGADVRALVITAREDREIARQVRSVL